MAKQLNLGTFSLLDASAFPAEVIEQSMSCDKDCDCWDCVECDDY